MSVWDWYKESNLNPMSLFHQDDPAKAANKYMDQIPGIGKESYNPFIESGKRAGGTLEAEYGKQLNPTSFIDDIMKNYSMSKGAEYKKDQLSRGIGATAAAGGFAGTPEHQREYGEMSEGIMSDDMHQYLMDALGVYGSGIKGEQDIYGKGFDASGSLADYLGSVMGAQGGLAFQGVQQRNANNQALMNALIKAFSQGGGAAAGGI